LLGGAPNGPTGSRITGVPGQTVDIPIFPLLFDELSRAEKLKAEKLKAES
jgi:hypothetical protein